ncbi:MAG: DNA polymerase IV [Patescibacteria group bacterium]|nr:DNA polymerase IV [Patescibacteria group bacterium]
MPESSQKTILHIDFDSFFASCEQEYDPSLQKKPVGVTAVNGRTCIIAASREAKILGIKTGTRTFEAKKICPSITFVPANFVKYWEVSKKFINICKDYSPFVEVFSIDELFIDSTPTLHLFGGAYGIISKIKKRIKTEIGQYITASFGISYNKLLAKLASGLDKPNGIVDIEKKDVLEIYKKAKLTDICGIGERIKARLNKIGIYSLLQLRDTPLSKLLIEFGNVEGHFLKNIGLGVDESEIIPYSVAPDAKSVGRSYCLPKNEYDKKIVLQNIYELSEEVGSKLRKLGKKAKTICFYFSGNTKVSGRKTYKEYFDTGKEIFDCIHSKIPKDFYSNNSYIRQIHLWVSHLEDKNHLMVSLFDFDQKKEKLTKTVDKINEKFGDHTIRNGFLLYSDKLSTVPNGYGSDKYERIKLADSANRA